MSKMRARESLLHFLSGLFPSEDPLGFPALPELSDMILIRRTRGSGVIGKFPLAPLFQKRKEKAGSFSRLVIDSLSVVYSTVGYLSVLSLLFMKGGLCFPPRISSATLRIMKDEPEQSDSYSKMVTSSLRPLHLVPGYGGCNLMVLRLVTHPVMGHDWNQRMGA